jgi:hypothetical protein
MKWLTESRLLIIAYALTAVVDGLAIIIWAKTLAWDLENLSLYNIFPLLGLLAFSTMLVQYVIGTLKNLAGLAAPSLDPYFNYSGLGVTALIVLHPSLLVWQLWRDGLGLPPTSYYSYVAPGLRWALLLGVFSLFIFLSFELRHRYHHSSWWKYIDHAQDVAIVAIYFHAFKLGTHVQISWFYPLWLLYGVVLAAVLLYKYYGHYQRRLNEA